MFYEPKYSPSGILASCIFVPTKIYFASLRRGKLRSRSFQGLREIFPLEEVSIPYPNLIV
jgi:hypothetical protein